MRMSTLLRRTAPSVTLLLVPGLALAHTGHDAGNLMAGVMHPLTGLDHVLMIVAVSAWAALLPWKGRLVVAACLALFVGAGALLPVGGGAGLESAIALTVIGAGTLLALGRRLPLWATGALAAVFALIHGFAHGVEGPAGGGAAYILGLVLATGLLALAVGALAAWLHERRLLWRTAGIASAATGAVGLASSF